MNHVLHAHPQAAFRSAQMVLLLITCLLLIACFLGAVGCTSPTGRLPDEGLADERLSDERLADGRVDETAFYPKPNPPGVPMRTLAEYLDTAPNYHEEGYPDVWDWAFPGMGLPLTRYMGVAPSKGDSTDFFALPNGEVLISINSKISYLLFEREYISVGYDPLLNQESKLPFENTKANKYKDDTFSITRHNRCAPFNIVDIKSKNSRSRILFQFNKTPIPAYTGIWCEVPEDSENPKRLVTTFPDFIYKLPNGDFLISIDTQHTSFRITKNGTGSRSINSTSVRTMARFRSDFSTESRIISPSNGIYSLDYELLINAADEYDNYYVMLPYTEVQLYIQRYILNKYGFIVYRGN